MEFATWEISCGTIAISPGTPSSYGGIWFTDSEAIFCSSRPIRRLFMATSIRFFVAAKLDLVLTDALLIAVSKTDTWCKSSRSSGDGFVDTRWRA